MNLQKDQICKVERRGRAVEIWKVGSGLVLSCGLISFTITTTTESTSTKRNSSDMEK
uniref:Uncharacterized protein n=1 Tax=Nelumbo nucifera TaxID=4432 RepID=A0A822XI34_NELNU|nr:TPA_asm: hypothetical protein HUJ06_020172 [Nelumbo nucifera]